MLLFKGRRFVRIESGQVQGDVVGIAFRGVCLDFAAIPDYIDDRYNQEGNDAEQTVAHAGKYRKFRNSLSGAGGSQVHGAGGEAYSAAQHDNGNSHNGVITHSHCHDDAQWGEGNKIVQVDGDAQQGEYGHQNRNYQPFGALRLFSKGAGGSLEHSRGKYDAKSSAGAHQGENNIPGVGEPVKHIPQNRQWINRRGLYGVVAARDHYGFSGFIHNPLKTSAGNQPG